jgi:hypothetical protein
MSNQFLLMVSVSIIYPLLLSPDKVYDLAAARSIDFIRTWKLFSPDPQKTKKKAAGKILKDIKSVDFIRTSFYYFDETPAAFTV